MVTPRDAETAALLQSLELHRTELEAQNVELGAINEELRRSVAAANAIHALRPDLRVVLITGYGEIPPEAGSVFTAMLAKPFDLAAMRALLRSLLPETE